MVLILYFDATWNCIKHNQNSKAGKMYICYGNWTCFENRQASSNPGNAFGVKRIFDFIAALWLNLMLFFHPPSCCVYACVHVHKCVGFSFNEAVKSLYEMKRFEVDGSL